MNQYMELAIDEARKGVKNRHGGPFGAVIVCKGNVIAIAHNTVLKSNDPTCHAEIEAIRKACKELKRFNLSDCEIYTTGKPCPMCRSALQWAKIKKVYYGCGYNDATRIGFDEKSGNNKSYTEKKLDTNECKKLYSEYTLSKPKKY